MGTRRRVALFDVSMTTHLRLTSAWRLVYDHCHGCGEQRDVVQLMLHGASIEIDFNLCRYCARELRLDVAEIDLHAGWIERVRA